VTQQLKIRLARSEDIESLFNLRARAILKTPDGAYSRPQLQAWARLRREAPLLERMLDRSVLVAERRGLLVATAGIDLSRREMVGLFVDPDHAGQGVGRRMVAEVEKLAVRFSLFQLEVQAALPALDFYTACQYRPVGQGLSHPDPRTGLESVALRRRFPRRATAYSRRVRRASAELGIPQNYGLSRRLPMQGEAKRLESIGKDIYGREQRMTPGAARAWDAMRLNAMQTGIDLQPVSAYRSFDYQAGIVRRKLAGGQPIRDILKVSAAPGFSEHHGGRALDITTPGYDVLEEDFEGSPAFDWLQHHAAEFGFSLSFPRDNRHRISYEPWHWAWSDSG
jgi:D-alanyl-D-alanine carboxypeptidase